MHQFVSVNRTSLGRIYESTDEYKLGDDKRCLRYNIDDGGNSTEFICPKDACLPEFPPTNPSWRTCKRKFHKSLQRSKDRMAQTMIGEHQKDGIRFIKRQ